MLNPYTFYKSHVRDSEELFIGSSDIPVIIKTKKTSIKKSQRDLWLEKLGKVKGFEGNEFTAWGHHLEPLVLAKFIENEYGQDTAFKFKLDAIKYENERPEGYEPPTDFLPYTECRHPKFPWAVAHADCLVLNGDEPYLLEAKTGGYWARVKRDGKDGFDTSDNSDLEDPDKIPIEVMLQVQWQMLVYGVNLTYVLLLVDDNKFYQYKIPAIKKWHPMMIEKASRFINLCKTGEEPTPEKKEDVFDMFDRLKDSAVYVTGDRSLIAQDMKRQKKILKKRIARDKKELEDINDSAVLLMQDNKFLYDGETGQKLFSQSFYKTWGMIHKNSMDDEDIKKYIERGILKENDVRKVN